MGRNLTMSQNRTIHELHKLGWSNRRIGEELGIDRRAVARALEKQPSEEPAEPQASQSKCLLYQKTIEEKLLLGLSLQRIWQDLQYEVNFDGGYDSVKRFVRKLTKKNPEPYARIETSPGHEAQVDFGEGAPTRCGDKYKRPFLFVMTLSFSRHAYQEVVWRQDVETFIRCHENAFRFFGGVVRVVRLDNLKAGVLTAYLFEPELNRVYESYAHHAGFIPVPCLPRTPQHKGKVESGVKYTQDNALKGRRFDSLDAQNSHLRHWNITIAFLRKHGTTKQVVAERFEEEKPYLRPLPSETFIFFRIAKCRVHSDSFVEVDSAYYMAPCELIGKDVDVHWNANSVKIYHSNKLLVSHPKVLSGTFQKAPGLVPESKMVTEEEYLESLLSICTEIGSECREWAEKVWNDRRQLGLRTISGIKSLKKSYSNKAINIACSKALAIGTIHYHSLQVLCEAESIETTELTRDHEVIRDPAYYEKIINEGD
jgi:transposase